MSSPGAIVTQHFELGPQWPTLDPFLFVAHHHDAYPPGNASMGPEASLQGRRIGMDFDGVDGWNMYHGATIPGFPQHPHRGFETITYVRSGYIDHADSLGATARFGPGDTQWMTAGAGVVHAEMFPLINATSDNPLELFQIWLNLPAADKLVDPYFTMLWQENTPTLTRTTDAGGVSELTVVAGRAPDGQGGWIEPLDPPPNSWAARPESEVAIWHLRLSGDGTFDLPAVADGDTRRVVYAFEGSGLRLISAERPDPDHEDQIPAGFGGEVDARSTLRIRPMGEHTECLVMQGRPIGEPVFQHGPFVMNDREGIVQTIEDYQRTGFGGWPWPSDDPVHDRNAGRFAIHADGRREDKSPS